MLVKYFYKKEMYKVLKNLSIFQFCENVLIE